MQPLMMIRASTPEPAARPHAVYKRQLLDRLLTLRPRSLLDVGCGVGGLLLAAREAGVEAVVGVEPEASARSAALRSGLEVVDGCAEALPFPDHSFDVVTLDYVAHHTRHLSRSLSEAARVARRALLILDCWFDDTIPSQRVARRYDEWLKRLDRKNGYVHNPCPDAAQLIDCLGAEDFRVEASRHLLLSPLDVVQLEAAAREKLSQTPDPACEIELENLLDEARLHGISDDGCLLVAFVRVD